MGAETDLLVRGRRYSVPQLGSNTVPIWMSTGTVDPIMKVGMQEAIVASVAAVR